KINNHNAMVDRKGRFWLTAAFRAPKNPAFCQKGSDHPSARLTPLESNNRTLAVLDPKSMKYTFVDTCFTTHHLNFAYDANDTLCTPPGGGGAVVGSHKPNPSDETDDAAKAQGWTPLILDTKADGKRGEYPEPNQPMDPTKDRRLGQVFYAVMVNKVDGTIWGTIRANPGAVVRLDPGKNPPETALAEIYNVPMPGFGPRGGDIDGNGGVWVSLPRGPIGSLDP